MSPRTLTDLPNEVIYQVLKHIDPLSVTSLELVSKDLRGLARQPILWQHFCRKNFQYWAPYRAISQKFADNVTTVDWKSIYSERQEIDRVTIHEINGILSSQTDRLVKSEKIVGLGYDAKDTLMRQLRVGKDAEDVLARRYRTRFRFRSRINADISV